MDSPEYWPLPGLRLRAGPVELRLPDAADLTALAALAEAGVHEPEVQPFAVAWTDVEPAERAISTMRYHWSSWGSWQPSKWTLNLVTVLDGVVVGTQEISATDFAVMREVATASWLGKGYQGQGIGTAMRAAVLALAFDGLEAEFAVSGAFVDNAASLRVSRKLGYVDDGIERTLVRGKPQEQRRLRLDKAAWQAHRTIDVTISGLEPCLPFFGAASR
jgi:RimJ/RimL family protein N-acetyltransferase